MSNIPPFDDLFAALTGDAPFPWQRRLFELFAEGRWPECKTCALPTGLGKTAVIPIWLMALAENPGNVPRRLVYVVNRRTVVDQTTNEVERLRSALASADGVLCDLQERLQLLRGPARAAANDLPLAISTLRGQFADNREWSADPARPGVIVGTVDMIGSRLLFSGYGVGFKARPLHAGFLGQDALIVHDEAHLEPAFQELLRSIEKEQQRCGDSRSLRVIELTATTRIKREVEAVEPFTLDAEDRAHPIVRRRVEAAKHLTLHQVSDDKSVAQCVAKLATEHKDANAAVLIFVRSLESVGTIEHELKKTRRRVVKLTGTLRGKERDELVETAEFRRFYKGAAPGETVYLVATSAGEVGIDISADHMVCDLSTLESMAQRFGRVNRYGERSDTRIEVVFPEEFDGKDPLAVARGETLAFLKRLEGDASPKAIGDLLSSLPDAVRDAAFAPQPTILPATDILFDAWALTSIRARMPGRPPVEPYLHGKAEWQPPETHVAWREEVEKLAEKFENEEFDARAANLFASDVLDDFPLKPHELLRDRSDRVFKQLELLAKRHSTKPAWLLDDSGLVEVTTLGNIADRSRRDRINDRTVVLPPSVGGLSDGMLDGNSKDADDVSCGWFTADGQWHPWTDEEGKPQRSRVWSNEDENVRAERTVGMRRVCSIKFASDGDDDEPARAWDWFEAHDREGDRTARREVTWKAHVDDVVRRTAEIVGGLALPREIADAVLLAATWHDHGKLREWFQTTLGNRRPDRPLAKSDGNGARLPEPFRHEFASALDAARASAIRGLDQESQDLVLHLIAAHHGRARPHFARDELDPDSPVADSQTLAAETPRRFARLQRRFGRWGLAYLESLLRAADWAASADPSPEPADAENAQ